MKSKRKCCLEIPKKATNHTKKINQSVYKKLDFNDKRERKFAERGLLVNARQLEIKDEAGKVVWSQKAYDFINRSCCDTANPSLWRNTQLNHLAGLFKVMDGIYQIRGFDMTNITFIEGESGWIVFDPLMSVECSRAALELVNDELGVKPIKGIILSHPHVDHYGGIKGIISDEEAKHIPIIAPVGFEEHAISENLYVKSAMGRRASYQYGTMLDKDERGALAIGIGMGQSVGTISYIAPNDWIENTKDERTIDGVKMEFQLTPETEAPIEMNTWFPDKKALWMAENCTGTLHNIYTLRGAKVRDGNAWANYLMEALAFYGSEVEVVFQSHNWPHWGNAVVKDYLTNTAAVYKFINDQTLLYINQGYKSDEISNMIKLPAELEKVWYTRQYYGTVAHNAKAVYQRFMGWYDANPVHLNPLPPVETAKKFIKYLGNEGRILRKAKKDFKKGAYQWVANITNLLVFANPSNKKARNLCADALEQLGYQSESGAWRNAYLSGALELRHGLSITPEHVAEMSNDILREIKPHMVLDTMGIHLDTDHAQHLNSIINIRLSDADDYVIYVKSGVLLYQKGTQVQDADATIKLSKRHMFLLLSKSGIQMGLIEGLIQIEGDESALLAITGHMVDPKPFFNIIEP